MEVRVFIDYRDRFTGDPIKGCYCILNINDENDRNILNAIYDGREDEALDLIGWDERDMRITRIAA